MEYRNSLRIILGSFTNIMHIIVKRVQILYMSACAYASVCVGVGVSMCVDTCVCMFAHRRASSYATVQLCVGMYECACERVRVRATVSALVYQYMWVSAYARVQMRVFVCKCAHVQARIRVCIIYGAQGIFIIKNTQQ